MYIYHTYRATIILCVSDFDLIIPHNKVGRDHALSVERTSLRHGAICINKLFSSSFGGGEFVKLKNMTIRKNTVSETGNVTKLQLE